VVREFAPVPGGDARRARLQRIISRDKHHTIQLAYDARGLLEWVRDCGGRLIAFVHDKQGRLVEVKLPLSRESGFYRHLKYVYGASGDLVEVVDAAGHSWKFEYQGHLLVQETDRAGLSFYFQYDSQGASARCVRTWGDGGIYDHVISYDVQKRKTLVEDSLGAVTVYQMDELGMVVKVVDPHGAVTEYGYDEDCGALAKETDALGHTRTTTYDERGNAIALEGPDGSMTRIEYDANHLPVRATDALGATWTWGYDLDGHFIEGVTPTGEKTHWGWQKGLLVWRETPGGRRTSLEYDKQKNVTLTRAPNGAVSEFEYDGQGRLVRMKDARGAIARFRYDALGHLLRVESPTGVMQELAYDAHGNLLEARDATRHVRLRYGHFHKVLAREEAGATLRFDYDTEGRLTGVLNEAGEACTLTLDACGRVQEERGFDGGRRVYHRDELGRVTRAQLPSGRTSEFAYDGAGRLLSAQHSDGAATEFTYRADGALVRAKNENALVVFERDALGRVVRELQGDHEVVSRFDTTGERTLLETSLGGRMAVLRDILGEVTSLHFGEESLYSSQPAIRVERDALGLEAARVLPGGVRVEWQRDRAGRPTARRTLRHLAGALLEQLDSRTYEWRGEDQIAAIVDAERGPTLYSHDARGRLVEQSTSQVPLHRAMDAVGNVFRTTARTDRRYAQGGLLQEADGIRYVYDEDGNQKEKIEKNGSRWRYHWNGAGMLSEVERPDGLKMRFEYDAFARRTRKTCVRTDSHGSEVVESEVRFVWDGSVVVHEVSDNQGLTTWYWEPETFTPVAMESGGDCWPIATDHLGTPTEMYSKLGQLAWKMQLDSFGVARTDIALQHCPWRWPGQYEDEETGLYYNRFRYYDPRAGRYISQDPLGLAAGTEAYGYPANPSEATDPLGLAKRCTEGRVVYRQLSLADRIALDAGQGLTPKGVGGSIADHVAGHDTQHISASLTEAASRRFASGNGVVAIDVDAAIARGVGFIDHNNVVQAARRSGTLTDVQNAIRAEEVLFRGSIPPEVIRLIRSR
jgi:RHS repeat-associated protein